METDKRLIIFAFTYAEPTMKTNLTFGPGAFFSVCYNTKTCVKSDKTTCILTENKYQKQMTEINGFKNAETELHKRVFQFSSLANNSTSFFISIPFTN